MASHWGGGGQWRTKGGGGTSEGGDAGGGGGMGASLGGGARPACIGANLKAALSRAPRSLFFLLVDFCPRTKGAPKGGGALIRGGGGPMETLGTPPGGGGGLGFSPRTFLNRSMSVARGEASDPPPPRCTSIRFCSTFQPFLFHPLGPIKVTIQSSIVRSNYT